MRHHARILTSIWQDSAFVQLSVDAQWLYVTVLSQADLSLVGVVALTPKRWAHYSPELTDDRLEMALKELVAARFVLVDEKTQEVAVRSFLKHDGALANPNMLKATVKDLEAVLSPTLRAEIVDGIPDRFRRTFETSFGTESGTASETAFETPIERRNLYPPPPPPSPSTPPPHRIPLPSTQPLEGGEEEEEVSIQKEEEEETRSERVQQALALLARRDLDAALARGTVVAHRAAWLRTAATNRAEADGPRLAQLHAQHPGWTATRLVNALDQPRPRVPEYIPEGVGKGVGFGAGVLKRVDDEIGDA